MADIGVLGERVVALAAESRLFSVDLTTKSLLFSGGEEDTWSCLAFIRDFRRK